MSNRVLLELLENNISTLQSALTLMEKMPDGFFTHVQTPYFTSSFGKHLRHILDHYLCFCRAMNNHDVIDYDQRFRNCQLETDSEYAAAKIKEICHDLETYKAIQSADLPVTIMLCCDVGSPEGTRTISSVGRELQFLQGHSVHHYALMAAMLKLADAEVDSSFGVAPSTIVHEQTVMESA